MEMLAADWSPDFLALAIHLPYYLLLAALAAASLVVLGPKNRVAAGLGAAGFASVAVVGLTHEILYGLVAVASYRMDLFWALGLFSGAMDLLGAGALLMVVAAAVAGRLGDR